MEGSGEGGMQGGSEGTHFIVLFLAHIWEFLPGSYTFIMSLRLRHLLVISDIFSCVD